MPPYHPISSHIPCHPSPQDKKKINLRKSRYSPPNAPSERHISPQKKRKPICMPK
ncbi:hypothetical protein BDW02DRAFT_573722 [Decorospora gaudefroyi]|uniref:Uncharacterized protein n=1 Tax=Decorospora gaudefroyi TaxID=184978 RepID=A0A6A5JZI5_9PLEO|nr:hypothetical protein BDW02DRAFT_573722 [Decorospora gaudefroyi]